ncbi:MAG: hypothetical protein J1E16_02230 [Muribaculaceae bacterium]|nr:hypothetical protein [Muribaculaceae bacterium]
MRLRKPTILHKTSATACPAVQKLVQPVLAASRCQVLSDDGKTMESDPRNCRHLFKGHATSKAKSFDLSGCRKVDDA